MTARTTPLAAKASPLPLHRRAASLETVTWSLRIVSVLVSMGMPMDGDSTAAHNQ